MIYAGNQESIAQGNAGIYKSDDTFRMPEGHSGVKLTVRVYDNPVYLEVSEAYPPTFNGNMDREMLLDKGFSSLSFVTPIFGFRFRASGGTARVDFRCYG